ncbi:MAG: CPBP family intramembrane glutamic endopeptidase [Rhabdaerophilum sp.]
MSDIWNPALPLWQRILRFPLTRLLLLGGIILMIMAISGDNLIRQAGRPLSSIGVTIGLAGLALAIYAGYARFIEGRPARELSLPGAGREWATGAIVGACLYSLSVLVLIGLGMYRIEGLNPWTYVIPAIAMALSSGMFEELLFRGVLFRSVEDMFGSWIALIASSAVFGLVHLFNEAGTLAGAIYISIEAGLLLAASFMLTRRLWLGIGFHMAWNYTQSAIFSGIVSGNKPEPGLIRSNIKGPDLLTGGSFGLESSVIAFFFCTATGILLLVLAVRRGTIVPPAWKR